MSIPAKASIIHCRSRENGNLSNQPCLSISPKYDSLFFFVILSEVEESSFLSIIFIPMSIGIQHVPHCHCEITKYSKQSQGGGYFFSPYHRKLVDYSTYEVMYTLRSMRSKCTVSRHVGSVFRRPHAWIPLRDEILLPTGKMYEEPFSVLDAVNVYSTLVEVRTWPPFLILLNLSPF